jgi:hypothetical protein
LIDAFSKLPYEFFFVPFLGSLINFIHIFPLLHLFDVLFLVEYHFKPLNKT